MSENKKEAVETLQSILGIKPENLYEDVGKKMLSQRGPSRVLKDVNM